MKIFKNIYDILTSSKNIKNEPIVSDTHILEENLRAAIELKLILQNNLFM